MGIDQLLQQRMDFGRENPQALMQSYQQNQELLDLLALQKLKSDKEAAQRDMMLKAAQQGPPPTVMQQREAEMLETSKAEIAQQSAGAARQQAAQQQQALQNLVQQGAQQQGPQGFSRGGIVRYAEGGSVSEEKERIIRALVEMGIPFEDAERQAVHVIAAQQEPQLPRRRMGWGAGVGQEQGGIERLKDFLRMGRERAENRQLPRDNRMTGQVIRDPVAPSPDRPSAYPERAFSPEAMKSRFEHGAGVDESEEGAQRRAQYEGLQDAGNMAQADLRAASRPPIVITPPAGGQGSSGGLDRLMSSMGSIGERSRSPSFSPEAQMARDEHGDAIDETEEGIRRRAQYDALRESGNNALADLRAALRPPIEITSRSGGGIGQIPRSEDGPAPPVIPAPGPASQTAPAPASPTAPAQRAGIGGTAMGELPDLPQEGGIAEGPGGTLSPELEEIRQQLASERERLEGRRDDKLDYMANFLRGMAGSSNIGTAMARGSASANARRDSYDQQIMKLLEDEYGRMSDAEREAFDQQMRRDEFGLKERSTAVDEERLKIYAEEVANARSQGEQQLSLQVARTLVDILHTQMSLDLDQAQTIAEATREEQSALAKAMDALANKKVWQSERNLERAVEDAQDKLNRAVADITNMYNLDMSRDALMGVGAALAEVFQRSLSSTSSTADFNDGFDELIPL